MYRQLLGGSAFDAFRRRSSGYLHKSLTRQHRRIIHIQPTLSLQKHRFLSPIPLRRPQFALSRIPYVYIIEQRVRWGTTGHIAPAPATASPEQRLFDLHRLLSVSNGSLVRISNVVRDVDLELANEILQVHEVISAHGSAVSIVAAIDMWIGIEERFGNRFNNSEVERTVENLSNIYNEIIKMGLVLLSESLSRRDYSGACLVLNKCMTFEKRAFRHINDHLILTKNNLLHDTPQSVDFATYPKLEVPDEFVSLLAANVDTPKDCEILQTFLFSEMSLLNQLSSSATSQSHSCYSTSTPIFCAEMSPEDRHRVSRRSAWLDAQLNCVLKNVAKIADITIHHSTTVGEYLERIGESVEPAKPKSTNDKPMLPSFAGKEGDTVTCQLQLETMAVDRAVEKYRELLRNLADLKRGTDMAPAQRLLVAWFAPLVRSIIHEQREVRRGGRGEDRHKYGPYLLLLPADKLAVITLHELLSGLIQDQRNSGAGAIKGDTPSSGSAKAEFGGARFLRVAMSVGRAVQQEVNFGQLKALAAETASHESKNSIVGDKTLSDMDDLISSKDPLKSFSVAYLGTSGLISDELRDALKAFNESVKDKSLSRGIDSQRVRRMLNKTRQALDNADWSSKTQAKVGSVLIQKLLKTARVPSDDIAWERWKKVSTLGAQNAYEKADKNIDPNKDFGKDSKEISASLAGLIFEDITDADLVPAFTHSYHVSKNRRHGVLRCHVRVYEILEQGHSMREALHAAMLPMVTPPKPWTAVERGGYLMVRNRVIRVFGSGGGGGQLDAMHRSDLRYMYGALNSLGDLKWSINADVLSVMTEVWEHGGGLGGLPTRSDRSLPSRPVSVDTLFATIQKSSIPDGIEGDHLRGAEPTANADADMKAWRRAKFKIEKDNRDLHSLRCDVALKLEVAAQLVRLGEQRVDIDDNSSMNTSDFYYDPLRHQTGIGYCSIASYKRLIPFYFPHNLDFRGRAYPIAPHLNHLGADFCRGLLCFYEAKPLGDQGFNWLKLQIANLFGKDKLPFDDRIKFTDEHYDDIYDSAVRPLSGNRWWTSADDPWQCLAACFELGRVIEYLNLQKKGLIPPDPNARRFLSRLPVHQDGSCNGLQHYAALGRDEVGAFHVDLLPSPKPQDVYSGVADRVRERVCRDADQNNNPIAIMLRDVITRKVVKQTVMTSVYGVTFVGARNQIQRRLKDVGFHEDKQYEAGCYLAKATLDSLGEIFSGATSLMHWLAQCAKLISTEGQAVSWVTPLGLPVVQPYRRSITHQVKTLIQSVVIAETGEHLPVSAQRQRSAFPPNFVHSLDSSHMLMTAAACAKAYPRITFASVHDSFWTHAGDVDRMNSILREQFILLHSQPMLEELRESFVLRFPNLTFPPLPKRGDLDLSRIRESKYFFD